MLPQLVVGLQLIAFETLDGRTVSINPAQIVTVSEVNEERDPKERLLTEKVHCVILLTNGTKISVADHCDVVKRKLEEPK